MPYLHWIDKENDLGMAARIPYRLLQEVPELSAGDAASPNMLIEGDNLEALKSLLPFFAGKIKCIYIDPPYNTGSAFEHYDDALEHTKWLSLMYPRLELLRELLAENGSIWVSIDDNEAHYLKVMMDEIFGRKNFICDFVWLARSGQGNTVKHFAELHEGVICFAKNSKYADFKKIEKMTKEGNFQDEEGGYRREHLRQWGQEDRKEDRPSMYYPVKAPDGTDVFPKRSSGGDGRWRVGEKKFQQLLAENNIEFVKNVNEGWIIYKKIRSGRKTWQAFTSILSNCGTASTATIHLKRMFGEKVFDTAKPESLVQFVFDVSTDPGDWVLDSFLGSGTSAAVAHKMGRNYIGIEMGDHAHTHCVPRLKKVIEGEQGGISEAVNWKGGGGYRFYRLGSPVFDEDGAIRPDIAFPTLAAHIYFSETGLPWRAGGKGPLLDIVGGRAYGLLYNGILGDKRPAGGNVLTRDILMLLRAEIAKLDKDFAGTLVVYGERSALGQASLKREDVIFKQTPYDVKVRA